MSQNLAPSSLGAGFVVAKPDANHFATMKKLITDQEANGAWDPENGWGTPTNKWFNHNYRVGGEDWSFNGGHADQGFLYYFFRFVLHDLAIVYKDRVVEFSGTATITTKKLDDVFGTRFAPIPEKVGKLATVSNTVPYNTFHHFTGKSKPWLQPAPPPGAESALGIWYDLLREVKTLYGLGVDVDKLSQGDLKSPLGSFSTFKAIPKKQSGQ
mgnify:CR=1 FL=1|tara:strand:+ start:164 stop:799 length:636 start_codon:yes stop_codon:yes gene_type:complete